GHIQEVEERFSDYNIFQIPLFPHEVRGTEYLGEFARILFGEGYDPCIKSVKKTTPFIKLFKNVFPHRTRKLGLLNKDLQFIIFAGKGGVGKTSVAAATGLHLAKKNKHKKILVFSTDPAHSLSDSFEYPIGDEITRVNEINNLYAIQIDAESMLKELTEVYMKEIDTVFSPLKHRSVDMTYDYRVMKELFTISPPGLDEIIALSTIAEMTGRNEYDTFILDTAPTGHLIRFLELPHIILDWLKLIFRTILKYRETLRLCQLERTIEKLVKLSRDIKGIQTSLINEKKSKLVVVTIPEAMGIIETERLCRAIAKLEIPCRYLITNMVIPETKCAFCAPLRNEQQTYIEEIKAKFPEYSSFEIPLFREEIRGMNNLSSLARFMYGG
ncbi:MAG: TRC40/GET3/ArsA family transport-energizing ATPase, partial [Planctomycetes bacterium]|nr:TRC40/GET3/ArsA family transport-energizing ATPase [Planctomycetota bacterium]